MSLDRIQLPDFIIVDLYKTALVEIESEKETVRMEPKYSTPDNIEPIITAQDQPIKYLGQNAKNVIIIVYNNEVSFVNDNDLAFLTSILKACNFNLGDIAIINAYTQPLAFNELKETLSAKYVLLFGIEPSEIKLPFIIPQFQVQQYAGCTIIAAPELAELNNPAPAGKLLKSKLWLSLQRCFDL